MGFRVVPAYDYPCVRQLELSNGAFRHGFDATIVQSQPAVADIFSFQRLALNGRRLPRKLSYNVLIWIELAAIAAFGQFVFVVVAAVVACMQLRGLWRAQEAAVVQHIFDELNTHQLAEGLEFVYTALAERLDDPAYVSTIHDGTATASSHNELVVMHFFNEIGLLVHEKLISELIVPFIASPCIRSWERLLPVVELMRRRYPHAYTPFEALVTRARAVDLGAINSRFRAESPRLRLEWQRTARELIEHRITRFDGSDSDAGFEPRGD